MAFGLLCITIAAFCVMFGPGLALRGGEGAVSMHKAVDNMKKESTNCFMFFILQLLFFHMSSFLLMWLYYPVKVALLINVILLVFLVLFVKNGYEIFTKLYVKDEDAVTGQFKDFAQYENMYDLDRIKGHSPEGRRGRSGSDDHAQRLSAGKLDLHREMEVGNRIGTGAAIQNNQGNPFEI